MNIERQIRILGARARAEAPPRTDVTAGVLGILAGGRAQSAPLSEKAWMWLAAVSSAVAAPLAAAAIVLYARSADPLMQVIESISWVTQ